MLMIFKAPWVPLSPKTPHQTQRRQPPYVQNIRKQPLYVQNKGLNRRDL